MSWHLLALGLFGVLALVLLRDGLRPGRVLISHESLQNSLPWSASFDERPKHNRFVGDQPRIFYPYLVEAARVYAGEADALWTTRGGGGQPFHGNMTSSLLHPLTLLAAVFAVELVPLLQALLVLTLSAFFTWAFLRRLGLSPPVALFGGLAFGFGGHQVLWLQYALSHSLLALPLCFWATERLVEDRSRRRLAILAASFALLIFGGHPETAMVAALVAGVWAAYRLWDPHGRPLVISAGLLAVGLCAVQWMPFLEYALNSHGLKLRETEAARLEGSVALSGSMIWAFFALTSAALLRSSATRGLLKHLFAVAGVAVTIVLARRMGMAMSAAVPILPEMYGSPVHPSGGTFTGAQDFPGLNAGFAGALPVMLLVLGVFSGAGGATVRLFGALSFVLWGAAHDLSLTRALVDVVPGLSEVGPTRLLGPVGFLVACGGAIVLQKMVTPETRSFSLTPSGNLLSGMGRVGVVFGAGVLLAFAALQMPVDPHGGRPVVTGLRSPEPESIYEGQRSIPICIDLPDGAEKLLIRLNGMTLFNGPVAPTTKEEPFTFSFAAQRTEDGRHRLTVEARDGEERRLIADQPLAIVRQRQLTPRDTLALGLACAALGWLLLRHRPGRGPWVALAVLGVDLLSFGEGYNPAATREQLYPQTETTDYLRAAWDDHGPFRIFTEGNILPPDTQFVVGVDHLLSYDNLGYRSTYRWLIEVPIQMDHFANFSFDAESVDYASPRFDALDVRYVVTGVDTSLAHIPGFELAHESETRIWENTRNLGRAWLTPEAMLIAADRRAELLATDPAEVALVTKEVEGELGGAGVVRLVEHSGSRVLLKTVTDGPALLILAENKAPGWRARVNGEDRDTLSAFVTWQAVPVPAGESVVEFLYDPIGARWGLRISIVAGALWLLMLVLPRRIG